jgi:hypothetical protein
MNRAACYATDMAEEKRAVGRPAGSKYPARLLVYATENDLRLLQRIADLTDRSQAGVVRQLIREKAKALGISEGQEGD